MLPSRGTELDAQFCSSILSKLLFERFHTTTYHHYGDDPTVLWEILPHNHGRVNTPTEYHLEQANPCYQLVCVGGNDWPCPAWPCPVQSSLCRAQAGYSPTITVHKLVRHYHVLGETLVKMSNEQLIPSKLLFERLHIEKTIPST